VVLNPGGTSTVFSSVSVGNNFACGAGSTNAGANIFCFGENTHGQAGSDFSVLQTVNPFGTVQLSSGTTVVSAGSNFACADDASGIVECWGNDAFGQLGAPAWFRHNPFDPDNDSFIPLAAGSGVNGGTLRLHGVSAGYTHACGIDNTLSVWCWGRNNYGETGSPTLGTNVFTAVKVSAPVTLTAVAVGQDHTCAIGSDNNLWCWGNNSDGQLGASTSSPNSSSAVQAVAPPL
jgi:alpha-tubulin suppressor-like RCC1 family protein